MSESPTNGTGRRNKKFGRKSRNTFTTKSGKTIKIHRNIGEKILAARTAQAHRKAARLAGMPKSPIKRFFYRLHPKRMYAYWFSREGAIMALKITGIAIITGFLIMVGVFAYFRKDLPNIKDISGNNIGGSIRYYDKTGQTLLWEDYDAVKRIPVASEDISQYVKDATIAIEDKDFFKHGGFDVRGITRAAINDVVGSGPKQGGSTITQQLVKLNNKWTEDQTYVRKIKELILAIELERSYTKQEILTGYLNAAPYGNVQYGVEAATRDYFEKSAKDLTIAEAAFLAAIPKAPSDFSPYGLRYDPESLLARQKYIIGLMAEQGMITQEEKQSALNEDVLATVKTPKPKFEGIKAPWFVLTAKQELENRYGADTIERGGWRVTTTLDLDLQAKAEEQVRKGLTQIVRQKGDTAAFVAEDVTTGHVVALVGGIDFYNEEFGQNNYATIKLPPGSSFKPYDYAALIEHTNNVGAGSVLYDIKGPLPGYPCTTGVRRDGNCAIDYDLRFPGPVTIRYALGGSRNIPAMKAMLTVGVDKTIETAKKMMMSPGTPEGEARGDYKCYEDEALTIDTPCYTAAAIGDGAYLRLDEHIHGIGTLARNGQNIPQTYILRIEDSNNKIIDEWKPSPGIQAIRDETAYIISDILSDPRASYLARKPHNYNGWKFSYKTGTTNDSKDGLMVGYSTKYAAGVWVGYHNRTVEMTGFMENMTQPILTGWMNSVHQNIQAVPREKPAGLKTLPAYVVRNHVGASSIEPSPATDLYPSWFQAPVQTTTSKRTVDVVSNKLATDCTPTRARKEVNDTGASAFSSDKFVTGGALNADLSQTDDIHKCDDARPSINMTVRPNSNGTYTISASYTQGTHPLSSAAYPGTITFSINGQTIAGGSFSVSTPGTVGPFTYTPEFEGSRTIVASIVDSVLYDASDSTEISGSVEEEDDGNNGRSNDGPRTPLPTPIETD